MKFKDFIFGKNETSVAAEPTHISIIDENELAPVFSHWLFSIDGEHGAHAELRVSCRTELESLTAKLLLSDEAQEFLRSKAGV